MTDQDIGASLAQQVTDARETKAPLAIVGGGSKSFYGRLADGATLAVSGHRGIVSYEPTELVLTARAGTPVAEIEAALAERGQLLPFEPPHFGDGATLGGTLACGLSGPRRPYAGAARDFVLGTRVLNGKGEILRFGGEVMKNVAGYDVSRLMVGALGTLGVLLEASLKVLPRPAAEVTLMQEVPADQALATMNALGGEPYPLSATAHDGERLYLRLSGARSAVDAAAKKIGGEPVEDGDAWWRSVREHTHPFFAGDTPLWRFSLPALAPVPDLPGDWCYEWGGAQRWLRGAFDPQSMWQMARAAGGHATCFRGGDRSSDVFQPQPEAMVTIQRNLKRAFDPDGILNPARLYKAW